MFSLDMNLVRAIVRGVQADFVAHRTTLDGAPMCLYEINNGLCEEFAETIDTRLRALAHPLHVLDDVLVVLEPACLQKELCMSLYDRVWDDELLDRVWGEPAPQSGSWQDLPVDALAHHVWLAVKVGPRSWLHFDAECPDGVPTFLQLPIFRRCLSDVWPTKDQVLAASPFHVF